ncbi:MAG: flavin reductase family protein [Gemmatimonadaceae bacterium]
MSEPRGSASRSGRPGQAGQPALDPDAFRSVMGRFATGITVVTAATGDGRDHGMTVSAFCSASLTPALVLVCVDRSTEMHEVLRNVERFAVNVLAEGQEATSRRFANLDAAHRFEGIGFRRAGSGVPLLDDALAHLECRITQRYEAGDHDLLLGEVEHAAARDGRPLLYYRGGYAQLER